ncbi:hypothetical protein V2G26_018901 [Clonostachys chloroleuca]
MLYENFPGTGTSPQNPRLERTPSSLLTLELLFICLSANYLFMVVLRGSKPLQQVILQVPQVFHSDTYSGQPTVRSSICHGTPFNQTLHASQACCVVEKMQEARQTPCIIGLMEQYGKHRPVSPRHLLLQPACCQRILLKRRMCHPKNGLGGDKRLILRLEVQPGNERDCIGRLSLYSQLKEYQSVLRNTWFHCAARHQRRMQKGLAVAAAQSLPSGISRRLDVKNISGTQPFKLVQRVFLEPSEPRHDVYNFLASVIHVVYEDPFRVQHDHQGVERRQPRSIRDERLSNDLVVRGQIKRHLESQVSKVAAASYRARKVLRASSAAYDLVNVSGSSDLTTSRPETTTGAIRFQGVSFAYPTRPGISVLNDFTLDIPAGKVTAIVKQDGVIRTFLKLMRCTPDLCTWYIVLAIASIFGAAAFPGQALLLANILSTMGSGSMVQCEAYLRQDLCFFDRPENTAGALTSRLSSYPQLIFVLMGFNVRMISVTRTTVVVSSILSIVIAWKLGLVGVFAGIPPLILSGYVRVRAETKLERDIGRLFERSASIASESVTSLKTVSSLAIEEIVIRKHAKELNAAVSRSQHAMFHLMIWSAFTQSIEYYILAPEFWRGSRLISLGEISFYQFFISFMSVYFCGQSGSQFFSYLSSELSSCLDI